MIFQNVPYFNCYVLICMCMFIEGMIFYFYILSNSVYLIKDHVLLLLTYYSNSEIKHKTKSKQNIYILEINI